MSKARYKTSEGQVVCGVTTIIGNLGWNTNALVGWARREALAGNDPDKIKEKGANIGICAHYLCECDAKGVEPDLSEYSQVNIDIAQNCFKGYLEWKNLHGLKEIKSEIPLVSDKLLYGGTIDMLYKSNGDWILGDIKTSNSIWAEHKIQVSAYRELLREHGYPVKEVYILHLAKNGEFASHKITNLDTYWQVFLRCLDLNKLRKECV